MSAFKNTGHLLRFAGLFVIAFFIFLIVRHFVVPKSFGEYGHYRGNAIKDDAARPSYYAGHEACEGCHSDVADKKSHGKHVHVNCEACHGPQLAHASADDPSKHKPVLPDTTVLCKQCHAASAAKPKNFPQVGDDHMPGMACKECHDPHSPAMDQAPAGKTVTTSKAPQGGKK